MNRRWLLFGPVLFAIVVFAGSGPSVAKFVPPNEPGTPLIVSGRVFDETGTHALAGVKLYAYHTDAKGLYNTTSRPGDPRLKGTVVTNEEGRFKWITIRPMPYPGGGNPAHIHIQASGAGYPEQWVDELWFSDDPYLSAKDRKESAAKGMFNPVVTTSRDAKGVLLATFNIRLSKNPSRH